MPIWKLTPTDVVDDDWRASTYKGEVVVRASDADRARMVATTGFGIAVEVKIGQKAALDPWGQDRLVKCICIENSDYDENGPAQLLSPENYG